MVMKDYINYPNPHITKHADPACDIVRMQRKPDQHLVTITPENAATVLAALERGDYRSAAIKGTNDLWLDLTLTARADEDSFVERVRDVLGQRYTPLARAPIGTHCP